jgi:hypothetical protein
MKIAVLTLSAILSAAGTAQEADSPRPVRIVLAGDSTVTGESGWGAGFRYAMNAQAEVINIAKGGRSSKIARRDIGPRFWRRRAAT